MEFIYIDNYMMLSPAERTDFLHNIKINKNVKIINFELISSEHSSLLSCKTEQDTKNAYANINHYFKDIHNINIHIVEKYTSSTGENSILFLDTNQEIRI